MATFTVRQGKRYRASIVLEGIERWASNEIIAKQLSTAGFADVVVSGLGDRRTAEAAWPGPDSTGEMPAQVTEVVEI